MRPCDRTPYRFELRSALLALMFTLCGIGSAFAQPAVGDPVEQIRGILRAPVSDLANRERVLQQQVQALDGFGDLARALVLREWRDEDLDQRLSRVDRP